MTFRLPFLALIREVQIAFLNYWSIETEVYVEPITVIIEVGVDLKNLTQICTLELVKDSAMASVNATVFGKNFMQVEKINSAGSAAATIDQLI